MKEYLPLYFNIFEAEKKTTPELDKIREKIDKIKRVVNRKWLPIDEDLKDEKIKYTSKSKNMEGLLIRMPYDYFKRLSEYKSIDETLRDELSEYITYNVDAVKSDSGKYELLVTKENLNDILDIIIKFSDDNIIPLNKEESSQEEKEETKNKIDELQTSVRIAINHIKSNQYFDKSKSMSDIPYKTEKEEKEEPTNIETQKKPKKTVDAYVNSNIISTKQIDTIKKIIQKAKKEGRIDDDNYYLTPAELGFISSIKVSDDNKTPFDITSTKIGQKQDEPKQSKQSKEIKFPQRSQKVKKKMAELGMTSNKEEDLAQRDKDRKIVNIATTKQEERLPGKTGKGGVISREGVDPHDNQLRDDIRNVITKSISAMNAPNYIKNQMVISYDYIMNTSNYKKVPQEVKDKFPTWPDFLSHISKEEDSSKLAKAIRSLVIKVMGVSPQQLSDYHFSKTKERANTIKPVQK